MTLTTVTIQPTSSSQSGLWTVTGVARTVTDGATTNTSTTVTSATANFGPADVQATIVGTGIPGGATIVSVTNSTTVVISAAATATATGVHLTITQTAAWAAVSSGGDTGYVSLTQRCLLDSQVVRFGFTMPTLPANAQVYSVGIRRRIQVVPENSSQPTCVHWFRSVDSQASGSTATATTPYKFQFSSPNPISGDATTPFITETIATFYQAPDGAGWNMATNLANFTYDMGRSDTLGITITVSEVYLDITYQQQSTVAVTGPAGTVQSTRPAIAWSYSSADSQPQQAYQVDLYTQTQTTAVGFSPFVTPPLQGTGGYLLGDTQQWILPNDLSDGTYVAYVEAKSKWGGLGDFLTNVASGTFTRTASSGGAGTYPPNATLQSATFDYTNNRVALTMLPSAGSPATTFFTVFASRDSGITWAPIPSLTNIAANGMTPVTQYDYVAPLNVTSQYRVLAYGPSSTTPVAAAGYSSTQSVTTSGQLWWLKDPKNPLANTPIPVFAKGNKIQRRRIQGTYEVLSGAGNVNPIVVNGPVYGETGTLVLMFTWDQPDYYDAFTALDKSGHVLLLQKPTGEQMFVTLGPGAAGQDTTQDYESTFPSVVQWRKVTVQYTQVNTPSYY